MNKTFNTEKNEWRRSQLLKRPPVVFIGELIPITFMFIARPLGLSSTITLLSAGALAFFCFSGGVLFYAIIRIKKIISQKFIFTMYWVQMLYWLSMYVLLISMTGEVRSISLIFAFGTVVYLMAEANFTQSIIFSFIIFVTYLATAVTSILYFKQPGSLSMEIFYSAGFLLMASYVSYVAGQWEKHRKELRTAKKNTEESKQQLEKIHKQLKEMDHLKTQFFQNITHEFRTPLTLIMGPLARILEEKNNLAPDSKKQLEISLRNGHRLMRLINQILDVSKLESGSMKANNARFNLTEMTRYLKAAFETQAKNKKLVFNMKTDNADIYLNSDKEKLEKIIVNLLSNAFKFTETGGTVSISLSTDDENAFIAIADSGKGISKKNIPLIFDRFRQLDGSAAREQEGTGIGLSLVKDLIDLLNGAIEVKSEPKIGTEFLVTIPLAPSDGSDPNKETVSSSEALPGDASEIHHAISNELSVFHEKKSTEEKETQGDDSQRPKVVLVEDNPDMRYYIKSILSSLYSIYEAKNGIEGLELTRKIMPDIVLSDLMMPKMDGNELLGAMRNDQSIQHIPFILLTAKSSEEQKIDELESGADDFLTKPFNPRELLARVNNILKMKEQEKLLAKTLEKLNDTYAEIKKDLALARTIQNEILPGNIDCIQGLKINISYMPLIEIGGDFYDISETDAGVVRIFLADATGHGISASLMTMFIKNEYEKLKHHNIKPHEVFYSMNKNFFKAYMKLSIFFTGIIIDINKHNGSISYASAGHPVQYIVNNGIQQMPKTGRAVGISDDYRCTTETLEYRENDNIILFTDGIFEEFNADNEEFGEERIKEIISAHADLAAGEIANRIMARMFQFIDNEINDDICIIAIE